MEKKSSGITLIEMILVIVLIPIIVPPLLSLFSQISWRSARSESINHAVFLGEQLMEEVKSKRFDENSSAPWSFPLAPEGGENYSAYDDVDDYNNTVEPSVINPIPGYTRSVEIVYMDSSIVDGGTWEELDPQSDTSDYKQITVTVSRDDGLVEDFKLIGIVSGGY